MQRLSNRTTFHNLIFLLLVVSAWPVQASTGTPLGSGQLQVSGTQLTVSPESQTVPQRTPTEIATSWEGDGPVVGTGGGLYRVLGDLSGPEIDGVLVLETEPGRPFRIPGLGLEGQYALDNIRLVQGEEIIGYASPRSSGILVTQILVVSVESRPLTLDEIRTHGIVLDGDNFSAFNFTFGFAVGGEVINYSFPVVTSVGGQDSQFERVVFAVPERAQFAGTTSRRFQPPKIAPFTLEIEEDRGGVAVPNGGCDEEECQTRSSIQLPGAIVFPTDISVLHQFFSVVVLAQNNAPAGDPLVLRDLTARMKLPVGLRQAETEPPTPLGAPVPIRVPGPDGELGTGDDLTFLVAQAAGEAEFLVEGLKEGTHVVDFELEGVLEGLPTGLKRLKGKARGAVLVRNPSLDITISHPEVVRFDENYSLLLTISNTGLEAANLVGVTLPLSGLSGVQLLSESTQTIETLPPGHAEVIEIRLKSLRTGRVVASSVRSGTEISPSFELTLGVGDAGIPLSPASLILPQSTQLLPDTLVKEATGLLGLGYSLSAAPSLDSNPDLPRVSELEVKELLYWMSQAGRHLTFGESAVENVAVLAAEWTGARYPHEDWDRLRRITNRGGAFGEAVTTILKEAGSPQQTFDRLGAAVSFLPGRPSLVFADGGAVDLQISSLDSGDSLRGRGSAPDRLRELAYADLYALDAAELALLARTESNGYQMRVTATGSESSSLSVMTTQENGERRLFEWSHVAFDAGGVAIADFSNSSDSLTLYVDRQGDGLVDSTLVASGTTLMPAPFGIVGAVQNTEIDPSGHLVEVLFTQDLDLMSLLPVDATHFEVPDKVSNGGLVAAEASGLVHINPLAGMRNSRVVRVAFNNPISPFADHRMTVNNLKSSTGELLGSQTVDVEVTAGDPGIQVEGRVIGPDGEPIPFARVELSEVDYFPFGWSYQDPCRKHVTAGTQADSQGRFHFDYVRQTRCSDQFTLNAQDPVEGFLGEARGKVRFIGETATLNIVMLGRGTVQGKIVYEDGTPVGNPRVFASSPAFSESRAGSVDSEGNYRVRQLPVGTVTVGANDGLGNFVTQTVEIPVAGAVTQRDLVIIRSESPLLTAGVRGRVFDVEDLTSIYDAYVTLYVDGNLMGVQRSGLDGRFDFGTVPVGTAEIEAFDGVTGLRGAQLFFELEPDQVNELEIPLRDERGTVEGYVQRQENGVTTPVEGAVVWVSGTPFNTLTDANGFYRLEDVFVGSRSVLAADLDLGQQVSAVVTVGNAIVSRRDLLFVVQDELFTGIVGEFLDVNGNPISGGKIHIAWGIYTWMYEAITDINGNFTIPGLAPGTYEVHGMRGGQGATGLARVQFEGHTASITLQVQTGTIRGVTKAMGPDGVPVGVRSLLTYRTTVVTEYEVVGIDPTPHTIETDANGTFEIPDQLLGPYSLAVSNAFHGEKSIQGALSYHGQVHDHEIIFQRNGEIRGVVLDYDGVTPVPGARVDLRHPNFADYDVVSGENGEFTFGLVPPSGRIYVDVSYEDGLVFRTSRIRVSLTKFGQEVDVEVVLPEQGTVAGWVENSGGGPVPGAVVTLREGSFPRRTIVQNADTDGFFRFENIFVGDVSISAKAPSLGGLAGRVATAVNFEGEEVYSRIILQDTGEIIGTVVHPIDGSVVPFAQVTLSKSWRFFDAVTADENGEFRFTLLPLGSYVVDVFDANTGRFGRSSGVGIGYNGQIGEVLVELEARGEVEGLLIDPDFEIGLPGVTVRLGTASLRRIATYASTDVEGHFEFLGIPEGSFTLDAREPAGYRSATASGVITEEGERVRVDLRFQATSSVLGTVLPPGDGVEPMPGVTVVLRQGNHVVGASVDNPFLIDEVIRGHRYYLSAQEITGDHRAELSGLIGEDSPEVTVEMRMVPIGSALVRVFDSNSNPVEGADLAVWSHGFYGNHRQVASTDSQGQSLFVGLGAGRINVSAVNPVTLLKGSGSAVIDAEEQVTIDVHLQDSGSIRGRVLLADGVSPAIAASVVMHGPGTLDTITDDNGAFEFEVVAMGAFTMHLQENEGLGYRKLKGRLDSNGQVLDLGDQLLDIENPRVLSMTPGQGTRDLPLTAQVVIEFSEPIDTASQTGSWIRFRKVAGWNVSYTSSWDASGTILTLIPTSPLKNFTAYEIVVETSVVDPAGRNLAFRTGTSFTTADQLAPTLIEIQPRNGQVGIDLAASIYMTFSEPVAMASLSGTALQLVDLETGLGQTTTFNLLNGERQVLLTPINGLEANRDYSVTVQGVEDLIGNAMVVPVTTTFRTVDTIAPEILSILPADGDVYHSGDEVLFTIDASDDIAVSKVTVAVGSQALSDSSAPYDITVVAPWVAADSLVNFTVTAVDTSGNTTSVVRELLIQPREDTTSPKIVSQCFSDGDVVAPGDPVNLAFRLEDDQTLESYQLSVNGEVLDENVLVSANEHLIRVPWAPSLISQVGDTFTVRLTTRDFGGNIATTEFVLGIPDGLLLYSDRVLDSSLTGERVFLGAGLYRVREDLNLGSLVALAGSSLIGESGSYSIQIDGELGVHCGASLSGIETVAADKVRVSGEIRSSLELNGSPWTIQSATTLNVGELGLLEAWGSTEMVAARAALSGRVLSLGDFSDLNSLSIVASETVDIGEKARFEVHHLRLDAGGTVTLPKGSVIDVTGFGYPGSEDFTNTTGYAPVGIAGSALDAGGSHGGGGLAPNTGVDVEVYDSIYEPRYAGGGGSYDGAPGGGVVEIFAGSLVLNGQILANGQQASNGVQGGAGGTVRIEATLLSGTGKIEANGANASDHQGNRAGPGGGGRVAIEADLSGFNPSTQVSVYGGKRYYRETDHQFAAPGTVLVRESSSTFGRLYIDGGDSRVEGLSVEATALPDLGTGSVVAIEPVAGDLWIQGDSPFKIRWLGTSVELLNASGSSLGVFGASEIDESGRLLLKGAAGLSASSYVGFYQFDLVDVSGGAGLSHSDRVQLTTLILEGDVEAEGEITASNVVIRSGATLRPVGDQPIRITATESLVLEEGASIDVSGFGYPGSEDYTNTTGHAPVGIAGSAQDAGGSHGGGGLAPNTGVDVEVYDSIYEPRYAGGGGSYNGAPGGGVVEIFAGSMVLNGEILANGQQASNGGQGGAGGTVRIEASLLSGTGKIEANGANASDHQGNHAGPGGGGRVAIEADLSGFNPSAQVFVYGGKRYYGSTNHQFAAPGTVLVRESSSTFGRLYVDGGDSRAEGLSVEATALPDLGTGSVVANESVAADLWIQGDSPFKIRWLGTSVELLNASGNSLGVFGASEIDQSGRLLLNGAAGLSASSYVGFYQFDLVDVSGGAGLSHSDRVQLTTLFLEGDVEAEGEITASNVVIRSGATLRPVGDQPIRITATESLVLEEGASIDVSGFGYPGSEDYTNTTGHAPVGIAGSAQDAGGSHGGGGLAPNTGVDVEVYDSIYEPRYAGGGGSYNGAPGGGVVEIFAGSLVLNGEILANGQQASNGGQGGAGGTVRIEASLLSGTGKIEANGANASDHQGNHAGPGGGGRVAIEADLSGFNPSAQVFVYGGKRYYGSTNHQFAAPGTVLVRESSSTFGRLYVDGGDSRAEGLSVEATALPDLGTGSVVANESVAADLWIQGDSPFKIRWLGTSVELLNASGNSLGVFGASEIDQSGRLLLNGAAGLSASSYVGFYQFDSVDVTGGAGLSNTDSVQLGTLTLEGDVEIEGEILAGVVVVRTGTLVRPVGDQPIRITATETFVLEEGASFDVSGFGYPGSEDYTNTTGYAPVGIAGSALDAGGSHGGGGLAPNTGVDVEVYDSIYEPRYAGGGGSYYGAPGGGVVEIFAGSLVLNGEILANGQQASNGGQGGAGGTVRIEASLLSGTGKIEANGADASDHQGNHAGPGGGGRVAIEADLSGFNPSAQVFVYGGKRYYGSTNYQFAAPGTVLVRESSSTFGRLYIDGGDSRAEGPSVEATALPDLGTGSVVAIESVAGDLWIQDDSPFKVRWLGTSVELLNASGNSLGVFGASEIDESGRLLLNGAAGLSASSYVGFYQFDSVDVTGGAGLSNTDSVQLGTLTLEGDVEIEGEILAGDVVVRTGTFVRPVGDQPIRITATETFVLEVGASIDVTGFGYPGSDNFLFPTAEAPEGVAGSAVDAGGSHGGGGMAPDSGVDVEVYDSVYEPRYAGGGGSYRGGAGGGVVEISAGSMVLDGAIRANGIDPTNGGQGGAGGTVRIEAILLSGIGTIEANGASASHHQGNKGGSGGGGRVAIDADLIGFDPSAQVFVYGGARYYNTTNYEFAAPGTVYLRESASVHGRLVIDGGGNRTEGVPVGQTALPFIYKGLVASVEVSGADLWVTIDETDEKFSFGVEDHWVRINGVDYSLSGVSTDRRSVLLSGAGSDGIQVGDAYLGVYKFDEVVLRGGAGVIFRDLADVGSYSIETGSTLVELDVTPPVIEVVQPAPGVVYASGELIDIAVTVTDNTVVSDVSLTLDDREVTLAEAPYTWSVVAPVVDVEQDVDLLVVAKDLEDNVATLAYPIRIRPLAPGAPPEVALSCPSGEGVVLAPGTGFQVDILASHDEGVERVELWTDSAADPLAVDLAPPFELVFVLPVTAVPGVVTVTARATSFTGTTADVSFPVRVVDATVIPAGGVLAAGDTTLDGQSLVVSGGLFEIEGSHQFQNLVVLDGAVVSHPATTTSVENRLQLELLGDLFVSCGGSVDVSARGYGAGFSFPNTTSEGSSSTAGGSHGGRGGSFDGSNRVFGSLFDPNDSGAGGGGSGSVGGGVARIRAVGNALIDGRVLANGGNEGSGPYGAGGSIRLDANRIMGLGSIEATGGGQATASRAAGSGGRIALYASEINRDPLRIDASGGAANTAERTGAAGTLFLKLDADPLGTLVVDNHGQVSTQWTELPAVGRGTVTQVQANGLIDQLAAFGHDLRGYEVAFGGNLLELWSVVSHEHLSDQLTLDTTIDPLTAEEGFGYQGVLRFDLLDLRDGGRVLTPDHIEATTVSVDSQSELSTSSESSVEILEPTPGHQVTSGRELQVRVGATSELGVRLVDFQVPAASGTIIDPPYDWTFTAPAVGVPTLLEIKIFAEEFSGRRFERSVEVEVLPLVDPNVPQVLFGSCPSSGDVVSPGTAVTLSFALTDNEAIESYELRLDGVVVSEVLGLNQPEVSGTFDWTVPVDATPGTEFVFDLVATDFAGGFGSGQLRIQTPDGSELSGDLTLDAFYSGQSLLLGPGTYTVSEPLTLSSLQLMPGAVVTGLAESRLDLTVVNELKVQCGASIDTSALGYSGATAWNLEAESPGWMNGPTRDYGGSFGGYGAYQQYDGELGDVYGSVYLPQLAGGGGSYRYNQGGSGGGVLNLTVGDLIVDGTIQSSALVQGGVGLGGGAGAGGSILINATTLTGNGLIDASGGEIRACSVWSGAGGGGRVAIYVGTLVGFDPATQVTTQGGAVAYCNGTSWGNRYAGAGTTFIKTATMTYGELFVDNGLNSDGSLRPGPDVDLPQLGNGEVTLFEGLSEDAWVSTSAGFWPRWLGAWMELFDTSGGSLGSFEVAEIDASGRARLAGAALATAATQFAGEYRFDATTVLNGARLVIPDGLTSPVLDLKAGETRLPSRVTVQEMTIRSGAKALAEGSELNLEVSGRLTIEAGGLLDATAKGYLGATAWNLEAESPGWMNGPTRDYGGSFGGYGAYQQYDGELGDVYGSVYLPQLAGGGGSYRYNQGGSGGGVLNLTVGDLIVDGTIQSSALVQGGVGLGGGAGAGGSILINATTLTGNGLIDASGGEIRACSVWSGAGGGGRVAIYVGTLVGFDPATQVTTQGGAVAYCNGTSWGNRYAGAGTTFIKTATMTYGELFVDNGLNSDGSLRPGPDVDLPQLGNGEVTLFEGLSEDAWVSTSAGFWPRWLGAWMELFDTSGGSLGSFEVAEIDASGRARLAGAALATAATQFAGEYRFDATTVLNGARLVIPDGLTSPVLDFKAGETRLPSRVTVQEMTIRSGAKALAEGSELNLEVSGRLTIEAGGLLDATAKGYLGATAWNLEAESPAWMNGPTRDYGGSFGGYGAYQQYDGERGDVYGSVYLPQLAGGGGSYRYNQGGSGGGVLNLTVGDLIVDGTIQSSALVQGGVGLGGGAGAGGSILISATTLTGNGLIDASGGEIRACSVWSGAGGGGRVAIYVGTLVGFDPATQVTTQGGAVAYCNGTSWGNRYAGAGTTFIKTATIDLR